MHRYKQLFTAFLIVCITGTSTAQLRTHQPEGKKISPDLFGLFFEDINYAADGGLYAELIQNRSFEYSPADRTDWHSLSFWQYLTSGYSYGNISVESSAPIHPNNPHYIVLDIEHVGNEPGYSGIAGVGIKNSGYDGIVVNANSTYEFSVFLRQLTPSPVQLSIRLQTSGGKILAEKNIQTNSTDWKKYSTSLTAIEDDDTAQLVVLATNSGRLALDMISLFPQKTFRNRPNGLRPDLAEQLAAMHPRFIRFPGGCLVHGDGVGNMYRWKNTIGPTEQRKEQRNIWGYHQTNGLGYFEYFQLCEDIGAKPVPVVPAGVSCQNSGGTWRVGGTGQQAIPMENMQEYIGEILDLVEWATGPVNSKWGSLRAAAGHPEPFALEYIGVGNEDKITPAFEERFKMIFDAITKKYPTIKVIGTSGPFHSGEDYDKGWKLARNLDVSIIDEHYYVNPEWLIGNQYRYDSYNRKDGQVYLGEYASWGNKLKNALAEASYMIGMERNGDLVRMASYAPLLAKKQYTQWKTDMIFFDNRSICLTPNYYVQQLFSTNSGDTYYHNIFTTLPQDSVIAASCVTDKNGDIILKMVNAGALVKQLPANLGLFKPTKDQARVDILTGSPEAENSFENPFLLKPDTSSIAIRKKMNFLLPPYSLTVVRIKTVK